MSNKCQEDIPFKKRKNSITLLQMQNKFCQFPLYIGTQL